MKIKSLFDHQSFVAHESHTLFVGSDFTAAEILRRNVLAVAVLEDGHLICKQCGDHNEQLGAICVRSSLYSHLDISERMSEDNIRGEIPTTVVVDEIIKRVK